MIYDQFFPKYFLFSIFHVFAIVFNYITHFTMFTMFHNISRKMCPKCFVKYCALISSKWQHCENFGLLQLRSLCEFPLLQCSLPPFLVNPTK